MSIMPSINVALEGIKGQQNVGSFKGSLSET
ncbi:hypothetical protein FPSE_03974 [Fusarium pseudograminearum CS3096]|uniref:Uncharacterized protein n=1 Tax=Fusarium pseudograminearum (strain CS3096) TaxID=1028729 RepID=K3VMB7_FUSPC|nr:hypothetical protein FPSE_03974 [Fusarium pseudograminearum CS3096]EKJ75794.1 hypothetical protein FPSE_03974 [Fusarium pseudograminearum CS3096]